MTQEFALCSYFHWTPSQVESMDEEKKMKYISFLKGISESKPKTK